MVNFMIFELGHYYVLGFALFAGAALALGLKRSPFPKTRERQQKRKVWLVPLVLNVGVLFLLAGLFLSKGVQQWSTDYGEWLIVLAAGLLFAFLTFTFPKAFGIPVGFLTLFLLFWYVYAFQGWSHYTHKDGYTAGDYRYLGKMQDRFAWESAQGIQFLDKEGWPLEAVRGIPLTGLARMWGGDALISPAGDSLSNDGIVKTFWELFSLVFPYQVWSVKKFPKLTQYLRYQYRLEKGELTVSPLWPVGP